MTETPKQGSTVRRVLRIGGTLLAVVAVVYIARQLLRDDNMASVSAALMTRTPKLLLAAGVYAGVSVLLCIGWGLIVRACGIQLSLLQAGQLYARTHLYRYLPSNVLHFVSRHGALYTAGAGHRAALLVNGLEIALQAIAALILAALLWPLIAPLLAPALQSALSVPSVVGGQESGFMQPAIDWLLLESLQASAVMVLLIMVAVVGLGALMSRKRLITPQPLMLSLGLFFVFFLGAGLSASLLTPDSDATLIIIVACAIAWLIGAVVPGASAGLGVREAVLVATLSGPLGQQEALVLALGYRLATVGGDVVLSLLGWLSFRSADAQSAKGSAQEQSD